MVTRLCPGNPGFHRMRSARPSATRRPCARVRHHEGALCRLPCRGRRSPYQPDLMGKAGAASASSASYARRPAAAEAAEIADELFEEAELTARRGRRMGIGDDGDAVLKTAMPNLTHDPVLIEGDHQHLLVDELRLEEGDLLRLLADVVPSVAIKGGDARG